MIKLQELRKEKGLYQKEIAKQLHRTVGCISNWELGISEPNIQDLLLLSKLFGVSIDYLVGNESEDGIILINNEITEDETNLLDTVRQLNKINKEMVYTFANLALDNQNKANKKNE